MFGISLARSFANFCEGFCAVSAAEFDQLDAFGSSSVDELSS
jgi:hypothetical protein